MSNRRLTVLRVANPDYPAPTAATRPDLSLAACHFVILDVLQNFLGFSSLDLPLINVVVRLLGRQLFQECLIVLSYFLLVPFSL